MQEFRFIDTRSSPGILNVQGSFNPEVGPNRFAFGVENIHHIHITINKSKVGFRVIEIQCIGGIIVESAQVDGKPVIDKDPYIIVAAEIEVKVCPLMVYELEMHFHGKMVIVEMPASIA